MTQKNAQFLPSGALKQCNVRGLWLSCLLNAVICLLAVTSEHVEALLWQLFKYPSVSLFLLSFFTLTTTSKDELEH